MTPEELETLAGVDEVEPEDDPDDQFDPFDPIGSAVAILEKALENDDSEAIFAGTAISAWRKLYSDDRVSFERLRQAAKDRGVSVSRIDSIARWKRPEKPKDHTTRPDQPRPALGWQRDFITAKGRDGNDYLPSRVYNIALILEHDPAFAGRFSWDAFAGKPFIDGIPYEDRHRGEIEGILEKKWVHGNVVLHHLDTAILKVQQEHSFHPVKQYLEALAWDGLPRINSFFPAYFNTANDDYHKGAAKSLFVSSVKRIYEPGCKVQTMTILQGIQGFFKSTAWEVLFDPWYAEVSERLDNKDFVQSLPGMWCMDFVELSAFTKADMEDVKRVLITRADHYRPSYGRTAVTRPRTCVFVGGTNSPHFNPDQTGGRRFIPVKVITKIDIERLREDRDQLWAEARILATDAGNWWDIPYAEEHQERIRIADSWEEPISRWLEGQHPGGYYAEKKGYNMDGDRPANFTTTDVMEEALKLEIGRHGRAEQTRVGKILHRFGYKARQIRDDAARIRRYAKPGD